MYKILHKYYLLCLSLLLVITLCWGCAGLKEKHLAEPMNSRPQGRLVLFLNGPPQTGLNLTFGLSSVGVFSEEGGWEELPLKLQPINSRGIIGRQVILAESKLVARAYEKLRFTFDRAQVIKENKAADLSIPSEGLEMDFNFRIVKGQDTSVFINWDVEGSIADNYLFIPAFALKTEIRGVRSQLAYVTNEGSDNVTVINREWDEVVSTIAVGKAPCGLAAGTKKTRLRVYVANSRANNITVIDPTLNQVEQTIPISFGRQPRAIAAAQTRSGKECLFVANYASNNVSIIDTDNYEEIEQVRVGVGPIAIITDPPTDTIYNMKGLTAGQLNRWKDYRDQHLHIYVANSKTNTVSVIIFNTSTLAVQDTHTLTVGWNPTALDVDVERGKVYVANNGSDTISIIDALKIMDGSTSDAVTTLTNVGTGGVDIAVDALFLRLYLLKDRPGEVLFLKTPVEDIAASLKSIMTPITGVIDVSGFHQSMALDPESRKLYVVDREDGIVHVIDKTSRRLIKNIPVGSKPYEITMVPF
ncbi:MAG: YncE family protein [Desulfovibrionales bacterium]|nr:YncE family protein [Desulfovibrionales bacterium]